MSRFDTYFNITNPMVRWALERAEELRNDYPTLTFEVRVTSKGVAIFVNHASLWSSVEGKLPNDPEAEKKGISGKDALAARIHHWIEGTFVAAIEQEGKPELAT